MACLLLFVMTQLLDMWVCDPPNNLARAFYNKAASGKRWTQRHLYAWYGDGFGEQPYD